MDDDRGWSAPTCIKLIKLYEQNEALWNAKDRYYYKAHKKEEMWIDIAHTLGRKVSDVKKKIDSLKGSYRRERSRQARTLGQYNSNWFAYNALKFLENRQHGKQKATKAKQHLHVVDDKQEQETEVDPIEQFNEVLFNFDGETNDEEMTEFRVTKTEGTKSNHNSANTPRGIESINRKDVNSKLDEINSAVKTLAEKNNTNVDECAAFGQYIEAKLRKLNDEQRTTAQHRINNILFEIEMRSHTNHKSSTDKA